MDLSVAPPRNPNDERRARLILRLRPEFPGWRGRLRGPYALIRMARRSGDWLFTRRREQ